MPLTCRSRRFVQVSLYAVVLQTIVLSDICIAQSKPVYPTRGLARYVIDNLDITRLSLVAVPREWDKRSFLSYGFVPSSVSDSEAVLVRKEPALRLHLRVLERTDSSITICLQGQSGVQVEGAQYPLVLTKANSRSVLMGMLSTGYADRCPIVGIIIDSVASPQ